MHLARRCTVHGVELLLPSSLPSVQKSYCWGRQQFRGSGSELPKRWNDGAFNEAEYIGKFVAWDNSIGIPLGSAPTATAVPSRTGRPARQVGLRDAR
jgi:hypothetical protein